MFSEEDLIPISALQHYVFCPRQCALIHIERLWNENLFTAQGRSIHEQVHSVKAERRADVRIVRGLRMHSLRLGLVGQADVVEFHRAETGISLPATDGLWQPFPIEYKRGKAKLDLSDDVQLCAQAICLEEMLGIDVDGGAMFYGRPRRRKQVEFTDSLREKTEKTAVQLHALFEKGQTPQARYKKKCNSCSLFEMCMPKVTGKKKNIELYLAKAGLEQ